MASPITSLLINSPVSKHRSASSATADDSPPCSGRAGHSCPPECHAHVLLSCHWQRAMLLLQVPRFPKPKTSAFPPLLVSNRTPTLQNMYEDHCRPTSNASSIGANNTGDEKSGGKSPLSRPPLSGFRPRGSRHRRRRLGVPAFPAPSCFFFCVASMDPLTVVSSHNPSPHHVPHPFLIAKRPAPFDACHTCSISLSSILKLSCPMVSSSTSNSPSRRRRSRMV